MKNMLYEEQKSEIETIKEHEITLQLSDEDCSRLLEKCGMSGLTVAELLQNFIGDLIGGTYSNGSDERMYANQWFDRCWFGSFPENNLLQHLLCEGYDPEDYIDALDNIEDAENDKRDADAHPEDYDPEDLVCIEDDIQDWKEELRRMKEDWHPDQEPDMDEQLQIIKKWVQERDSLLNGIKTL